MNRTVMIYAAALVVALIGSYLSWTHESNPRLKDGVVVLDIAESDLTEIRYSTKDFNVSVTKKKDALGDYVWVDSQREQAISQAPANPHAPPEPPKPDAPKQTVKLSFKAGTAVEPVIAAFTPFIAIRTISATPEQLEEFGLKDPKGKLELVARGKTHTYDVGEEGYGHRNSYLRDTASGAIYLVDGDAIRPLIRGDERLPERRLLDADMWKLDEVAITSGAQTVKFIQKNKSDQQVASWVGEGTDEANASARTWIEKFLRMRSIANPDSVGDAEDVMSIRAVADGKETQIKLLRAQKADGGEKWFATSTFTRGPVELPFALASNLADDFPTLVSQQP